MSVAPAVVVLGAAGWHWERLAPALRARGLRPLRLGFAACGMAVDGSFPDLVLDAPGALPAAVLVRSIPAGSFEQVTFRLSLLHALAAQGVLVVNDASAIERCTDKAMTTLLLARAGVATPPTWVVERPAAARAIVERETAAGHALVLKPLFGAQGKGLRLLRGTADLPAPEAVAGVFYLQRYIGREAGWCDYRVFVIGDVAVAAMARHGTSWITNVRQGGRPEAVDSGGELGGLAVAAAAAVGASHAGVDLMRDGEGRLMVLEVNSMPAWQGLQSVTEVDIGARLAAHLADLLQGRRAAAG
jgi:RimK family alpha-L-glutamate ligase